ncbi:MAG: sigma-54-dependent Fis family transcriptional regulator [Spirochaetes bacterium]|nr:sigma-54-dependent Fis family transcriptional regulator [Spirochaetota bacterium]
MKGFRIMVVDDEEIILDSIKDYLGDYAIRVFQKPEEASRDMEENNYDIIVSDYKMPGMNGLDFLSAAREKDAYLYGILLTAYADKDLLGQFIDRDVIRKVLEKPLRLEILKDAIDQGIEECRAMREERDRTANLEIVCREAFKGLDFLNDIIIGIDGGLREVFKKVEYIAPTNENVLITGETGTGKEVVARAIHFSSARKDCPFIKINCGAIPDTLIESELFGYVRGAFSGAQRDKPGKIELARGGTLFLDEIGELQPDMQTRLLHVVQERRIERLGSNASIDVDFRLISATNRNLENAIREKRFREDLYYRINTFPIHIPPLRERDADLPLLIAYLASKYTRELGYNKIFIDDTAVEKLKGYAWPGNIRELENVIKRAMLLRGADGGAITADDFAYLFQDAGGVELSYDCAIDVIKESILSTQSDLKTVEREIINSILAHFDGNVMEAVKHSGIPKDRFYRNR